jgi:hypothetical protein
MFAAMLLALLAPSEPVRSTSATLWIVDDDGGPGVDFTSITAAVAVALPGDVILVRAGNYAGFTLHSGVRILGESGTFVTSVVQITGLPAGPRATLGGLSMRTLLVSSCGAPVTIEDSTVAPRTEQDLQGAQAIVTVQSCPDVRLRHVTVHSQSSATSPIVPARSAIRVLGSRVEISASSLTGMNGVDCGYFYPGTAQPGAPGVRGDAGASVHVAASNLTGGAGGRVGGVECQSQQGGDGKAAIQLVSSGSAIVSGTAVDTILGGAFGDGNSCGSDGAPGNGIVVASGSLRVSGATITGASPYPGCGGPAADIVGPFTLAAPADPTLVFSGSPSPGQALTFTIRGAPGDTAQLVLGRQLALVDLPTVVEDQLLVPMRTLTLGVLPAGGQLLRTVTIPSGWIAGQLLVAQGRTTSPTGNESLTNSLPITVR